MRSDLGFPFQTGTDRQALASGDAMLFGPFAELAASPASLSPFRPFTVSRSFLLPGNTADLANESNGMV